MHLVKGQLFRMLQVSLKQWSKLLDSSMNDHKFYLVTSLISNGGIPR